MPIKIVSKKKTASNKEETGQKTDPSTIPPGPPKGSGGGPNAPVPFIDKISLVWTLKSAELAQSIHNTLYQAMTNDAEYFQSAGKPIKGFQRAKVIALPHFDEQPRIDYAYQDKLADRIRIEFNPSKLGSDGIVALHGILTSVMPNGWGHFVKNARITRLDVAVDIVGLRMSKLQMMPKQGAAVKTWSKDGKLQTYQWGKAKGTHIQIYNKTAQQGQKATVTSPQVTRVERRFKNPKCSRLTDLATMDNPFAGIVLTTSMPAPPPGGPTYVWPLFCDSVTVRGLDLALKYLPKHKRTTYRKQFAAASPEWWNPKAIWENWPGMLSALKIAGPKAWI